MKHFYEYLIYAAFVSYILSEKLKRVIVVDEKKAVIPHSLVIDGRKNISVTGVTEADNFSDEEIIISEILSVDPDNMTPLEALKTIGRWKKELSGL